MSAIIEEPWMANPLWDWEIPGLEALIYHPAGGPWGYIKTEHGRTIGYGPVKVCQQRVADLNARFADPTYAGPGEARALFPEAIA